MISIVCVYNNEKTYENVLLRGLEHQTAQFELIALDNRNNRFKSAAQALNHGGAKAEGDYIAFVHQDMWFPDTLWLEETEKRLKSLTELGVAGVAGVSAVGSGWLERAKRSITILNECLIPPPLTEAEEVQTLDECVLIIPSALFDQLKFDEEVFDGWDCYGADYCLGASRLGKKSYVIPGSSHHCCQRENNRLSDFKNLHKYQKRLFAKYRHDHKMIHTWMGHISWRRLKLTAVLNAIHPVYIRVFPEFDSVLAKALSGSESVLDLGCGHLSPIKALGIPYSMGVDSSELHIEESKRLDVHHDTMVADIREVEFPEESFDAVIALNVLEYLPKQDGIELLAKMQRWARNTVVISTPNTALDDDSRDKPNQRQSRVTAWKPGEFAAHGLNVHGLDGWRKLKPQASRFDRLLVSLTQKVVYRLPGQAVSLFVSSKRR